MISRSERDAQIIKRQKYIKYLKKVFLFVSVFAVIFFVAVTIYQKSQEKIKLQMSTYKCNQAGCNYDLTVKNLGEFSRNGFARVSATITINLGEARRVDTVGTERIEFSLQGNEKKIIKGFLKTTTRASRFNAYVGQTSDSI